MFDKLRQNQRMNNNGMIGGEGFIERQFKKVIIWNNNDLDLISYRYDVSHSEIMNGSMLIVQEGQVALFSNNGIVQCFGPGKYELTTGNRPLLSNLMNISFAFENTNKQTIFFLTTRQFTGNKWGSKHPINIPDPKFEQVQVRAFGSYIFSIGDPKGFYHALSTTNKEYRKSQITEQLNSFILEKLPYSIQVQGLTIAELSSKLSVISKQIEELVQEEFASLGLNVRNVIVENINLPEEIQSMLNTRTNINILGGMGNYAQVKTLDSMGEAAKNGSGSAFVNAGLGMGVGMYGVNMMNNAIQNSQQNQPFFTPQPQQQMPEKISKEQVHGIKCTKCDSINNENAKFCSSCGNKIEKEVVRQPQHPTFCCNCGTKIVENQNFCMECGHKVIQ